MDVGTTVGFVVRIVLFAVGAIVILWWPVSRFMSGLQTGGSAHDIDLAYLISKEDRDSLTREEYKQTEKMSYPELKAFLKERFPESVPEYKVDESQDK